MAEKVQRIINIINRIAPPGLAEEWDNVGLIVGDYAADVERVMVSLDATEAVLDEAVRQGVQLIISHHPMVFSAMKTIRNDHPTGKLIIKAIRHGIHIFAAHTNLDIADGGVNDILAGRLELTEIKPLADISAEALYKIVVFVPGGYEEDVRIAMGEAGAGWIGNYSHCTFQTTGTGTFKPLAGTKPFIGHAGELEKVKEVRLETVAPSSRLPRVIKAMLKVHPYEEVAYDIYPLHNQGTETGLGRIGYLPAPMPLEDLLAKVKQILDLPQVSYIGELHRMISKVAVLGGSGGSYIKKAAFQGADLFLTSDIKFHDGQLAESLGLALVDAGHFETEAVVLPYLVHVLQEEITRESLAVELVQSTVKTDPMRVYNK